MLPSTLQGRDTPQLMDARNLNPMFDMIEEGCCTILLTINFGTGRFDSSFGQHNLMVASPDGISRGLWS
jgi:hypothetical protein